MLSTFGRTLEALEFVEFDPMVGTPTTWHATSVMLSFLEKHFNCCLTDNEKAAILTDFPKPNAACCCLSLAVHIILSQAVTCAIRSICILYGLHTVRM